MLSMAVLPLDGRAEPTDRGVNAGLNIPRNAVSGSRALQPVTYNYSKQEWMSQIKEQFDFSDTVIVVKEDGTGKSLCLDVWKAKGGSLKVGDRIAVGLEKPFTGPKIMLVFLATEIHYINGMEVMNNRLPWCDLSLDEVKAAIRTKMANQRPDPTPPSSSLPAGAGGAASIAAEH
jgi:hypothetical protein